MEKLKFQTSPKVFFAKCAWKEIPFVSTYISVREVLEDFEFCSGQFWLFCH